MNIIFTSHCQNDWYISIGAQKLKNSAKYFHPDIELLVHGDNIINEVKRKYPWSSWYTFDPLIAEYYINEYDMIVHFDADCIITGKLDELLLADFDVAGVRNNNDIGLCTKTGGLEVNHLPGIDATTQYLNAGLIASTNKEFWIEFKNRNKEEAHHYRFGEQDVWNKIFYEGKYKTKVLDPKEASVYYGVSQQIVTHGQPIEDAWKRFYMKDGKLFSDNKEVKIIHHADGHRVPKLQYQKWVTSEVKDFLDTITN